MTSPCLKALLLLLLLSACDRESRDSRTQPLPSSVAFTETSGLHPGDAPVPRPDPRGRMHEINANDIGEGGRLYVQMNCVGCHAHGGGGMGPPLMDEKWRYGGRMDQIVASIDQGRPNGMPSWHDKLTPQQMWQLAAYVRSLSSNTPKDATPSRSDSMSNTYPSTLGEPERPVDSSAASVKGPTG